MTKLQPAYPKASINTTVYVREGGGCQHYKENHRVANNERLRNVCEPIVLN